MTSNINIQERIEMAEAMDDDAKERHIQSTIEKLKERGYEIIDVERRTENFVITFKIPNLILGYTLRMVLNWTTML